MERVRKNLVRLIFLCIAIVLSSCKEEEEFEGLGPTATKTSRVNSRKSRHRQFTSTQVLESQEVGALNGHVDSQGHFAFANVPSRYLLDPDLRFVLRVSFSQLPFSTDGSEIAINGVRGHPKNSADLSPALSWEEIDGQWWLTLDLTDLVFDNGQPFKERLQAIQNHQGKIKVWLRTAGHPTYGKLVFLPGKRKFTLNPTTLIDWVEPSGKHITSRSVIFNFHSPQGVAQFECAMDGYRFKLCQSSQVYTSLHYGHHRFSVRAISHDSIRGPITSYAFKIKKLKGELQFTSVTPEASPTRSQTLSVSFTSPKKSQTYCQLDGAVSVPCTSPYTITNLGEGAHTLLISAKDKKGNVTQTAYTWMVDQTAPTVLWQSAPANVTSSSSAQFAFSTNEASTFECALDAAAPFECQSPTMLGNLAEGSHEFRVTATDTVGNISPALSYIWVIDQTAPQVILTGATPAGSSTNIPELGLSFSASEASYFLCALDGTEEACASPFQAFNLTEGAHQIVVTATDLAGNRSAPFSYHWNVDLTKPIVTINLLSPSQLPTTDTTALIEVFSPEPVEFQCSIDGQVTSCGSLVNLTGLSEGVHQFVARAVDFAGNQSEATLQWTVDLTPPSVRLLTVVPSEAVTSSTSLQVEFDSNENAKFTCELNLGGRVPCNSPWSVNSVADGMHLISIIAMDNAGNLSTPVTYRWEVVTRATATIDLIDPGSAMTNRRDMHITFSGLYAESFACSLDGEAFVNCLSPMHYTNLSDGQHSFQVRGVSALGIIGDGDGWVWTIDSTAPVLLWSLRNPGANMATTNTTANFEWSANEVATFFCSLDNGIGSACASPLHLVNLPDGNHSMAIYGVDSLGNQGTAIMTSWVIDTTAPVVTLSNMTPSFSPTANTAMTLSFSANEAAAFYCSVDEGPPAACVSSFTVSGLSSGNHTVSINAVDTVGNAGAAVSYQWQIDTTPLTVSSVAISQITQTSAIISWTTNIPTTSQVFYGQSGLLSQSTPIDNNRVTSHTVTITGLKAFTVYSVQARSIDLDGRTVATTTATFRSLR